jgi:hypothetical protein
MKKHPLLLASVLAGFTVVTAPAQPGPPPGPSWDGAMAKLFGDNPGFTATMEYHLTTPSGREMTMQGKIAHLEGKARFEMDMSSMQGANMPPQAAARMKQMGMSKVFSITRRDLNLIYMVYPDMKAYVEMPMRETNAPVSDYKADVTKVGEESINGHDCIKNKVVVTCPDGTTRESTIWNATDLNKFPIKMQLASKEGRNMVLIFNDVKLEKPDAALFDPPTDFTKYDNMMNLMMSRIHGAPPQ